MSDFSSEAQRIRERHERARQRAREVMKERQRATEKEEMKYEDSEFSKGAERIRERRARETKTPRKSNSPVPDVDDYRDEYKILKSNGVCPFPTPREFAADLLAFKSTPKNTEAYKEIKNEGLLKYHPDKHLDKSLTKLANIAVRHWYASKGGTRKLKNIKNRLQRRKKEIFNFHTRKIFRS